MNRSQTYMHCRAWNCKIVNVSKLRKQKPGLLVFKGNFGSEALKTTQMCLTESPLPDLAVCLLLSQCTPGEFDLKLQEIYECQQRLFKRLIEQTTPFLNCEKIKRLSWKGKTQRRSFRNKVFIL